MELVPLEGVRQIVGRYGYNAVGASEDMLPIFENDLDEADKYDLSRTWRNDWKAELQATLSNSKTTFCVSSDEHSGAAIFGVTPVRSGAAQIWLLQSKSFVQEAGRLHGLSWPRRASNMTREVVSLFNHTYSPLFNFIPEQQTRNIKWLRGSGFLFFSHPDHTSDMLFFGLGVGIEEIAQSNEVWKSFLGDVHA